MITSELFSTVEKYILREISLEELEDWLMPKLPLFFTLPLSPDSELVAAIELGLAELSNNTRSEDELRAMIRQLIREVHTINLSYSQDTITTSTTSSNNVSPSLPYSPSFDYASL